MVKSSRRQFLQASAAIMASYYVSSAFKRLGPKLNLSFSTLGCPDWEFRKIVDFASAHQYSGLEIRGIQRQMDLPLCEVFSSPQNKRDTMNMMRDHGLQFVDLGSSATLHFSDPKERSKNLDEGRRFIDLAQELNCPFVRVFPNLFPKDREKKETMDLIIKGLLELGEHAKGSQVSVLIESHGDLIHTADLETVMRAAWNEHTGMIWDITNMWTAGREAPSFVYERLKTFIRHTHVKDAQLVGNDLHYTLLGQGEVPVMEALDLLRDGGYKGYYSFEWEKLWHPEILAPEIAIADFSEKMYAHFK